ncbi:MAG: protein-L-isoaspartate(D-aspartate) O-methyltransferase [Elusimicrobiota bacterium]
MKIVNDKSGEREGMVRIQIEERGIKDTRLLEAFRSIPRHQFVPEEFKSDAYADRPLPIGEGQTISQPFIVAEMSMLLDISEGDRILEIGTGSGYQTAILVYLGAEVYTVERKKQLLEKAGDLLDDIGLKATLIEGDGTEGYPAAAPYDGIIVTAAAPDVPAPLLEQLAEGGRLVIPVGLRLTQELKVFRKIAGRITEERCGGCMFVPLIGKYGWRR